MPTSWAQTAARWKAADRPTRPQGKVKVRCVLCNLSPLALLSSCSLTHTRTLPLTPSPLIFSFYFSLFIFSLYCLSLPVFRFSSLLFSFSIPFPRSTFSLSFLSRAAEPALTSSYTSSPSSISSCVSSAASTGNMGRTGACVVAVRVRERGDKMEDGTDGHAE